MHLLLTDRLTCPRCGPTFGLILLADRMVERRVLQGTLGCPNCRDSFTVRDGFADLRAPPRGDLPEGRAGADPAARPASPQAETVGEAPTGASGEESEAPIGESAAQGEGLDEASRVVALLGLHRGPGTVVTVGRAARLARGVAAAVEDLQAVAVDPDTREWREAPDVSRMVASPGLPFFTHMLRGAVVDGGAGRALIAEAARIVAPKSRVVVVDAPRDARGVLTEAGLSILAEESGTVVATRG